MKGGFLNEGIQRADSPEANTSYVGFNYPTSCISGRGGTLCDNCCYRFFLCNLHFLFSKINPYYLHDTDTEKQVRSIVDKVSLERTLRVIWA